MHINGYFALEQNRGHLQLPSADSGKGSMRWNAMLIDQLVPKCLVSLVSSFAKEKSKTDLFQEKVLLL